MPSPRALRSALLATLAALLPGSASAQLAEVADWKSWGAPATFIRDDRVPGDDSMRIGPRTTPGDLWSSGAGSTLPAPLKAGERVTAVFWARSADPTQVAVTIQGGAPAYASIAATRVALTPRWRRFVVTAVAPTDLPAGSQSLTVQTGHANTGVTLGPVAFLPGRPDAATVTRAFATFRPTQIAEDVRIPSEPDVVLAGTLRLPTGHGAGPFPLAILIQGHGPNGRGGYDVLIRRLLGEGMATLDYDKRGIGQSTGTYKEDLDRLIADATATVAAMRRRPDIDARRVALVGHSQGGVIAPAVAAADPTIAAVVTFAGSVGDGLPYLRRAIHNQMVAAGRPEPAAGAAADAAVALLQARVDGRDAPTIATLRAAVVDRLQAAGFPRPQAEGGLAMIDTEEAWHADRLHSASDLRSLRMPVLAVFGGKDSLVVAADEAPAAREALAGNPRARVVVLDGLSHWFKEGAQTGTEAENDTLGPNLGSPRAVGLAGDWLLAALAPAPARND